MDDDILGGLNELTETADKPELAKKVAREKKQGQQTPSEDISTDAPESSQTDSGTASTSTGDKPQLNSADIQAKLSDAKVATEASKEKSKARAEAKKVGTTTLDKAGLPDKSSAQAGQAPDTQRKPKLPITISAPITVLMVIAGMLVIFAFGMGYGAIIASHHFPYWFHKGVAGALSDWIAAPAGILLFPIISGLFYFAGRELHGNNDLKSAKVFYGISALAMLIAMALPVVV